MQQNEANHSPQKCDDAKLRFELALDRFPGKLEAAGNDPERRREVVKSMEEELFRAARAGYETARGYEAVAKASILPRPRLAYFARAYELRIKETTEPQYDQLPCCVIHHYEMANYLHEMGRIHEGDGDMKMAAELYQRSLQHLQDGADACDAKMNYDKPDVPRRPGYAASLARVQKFLGPKGNPRRDDRFDS